MLARRPSVVLCIAAAVDRVQRRHRQQLLELRLVIVVLHVLHVLVYKFCFKIDDTDSK